MKFRYFSYFMIVVLLFAVSITGCAETQKVDVAQTLSNARDKLIAGDYDGAYQDYLSALSGDPSDAEANFGAGLLGLLNVAVDEDTRSVAEEYGWTLPTTLNELLTSGATPSANASPEPQVIPSEVQDYIEDTLIPALSTVLGRLAVVESNPDFIFIVSSDMSGGDAEREIDLGEIYALDVFASLLKGMLHFVVSYNWDSTESNPLDDPDFGTLRSNGATHMTSAMNSYARAMNKWIAGINFIDAETDDQSNDVIPKFTNELEKDDMLLSLNQFKDSLENGDTTIDLMSMVSPVVDYKDYFSSPVTDWKDYYVEDANSDGVFSENEFPAGYDFTLSGLFPELTTYAAWDSFYSSFPKDPYYYENEGIWVVPLLLLISI